MDVILLGDLFCNPCIRTFGKVGALVEMRWFCDTIILHKVTIMTMASVILVTFVLDSRVMKLLHFYFY